MRWLYCNGMFMKGTQSFSEVQGKNYRRDV